MTEMEKLLAEQSVLIQKIIAQAKLDAVSQTPTSTPTSTPPPTLDLQTQIVATFGTLAKSTKDKNILTPYANPYNWPRNNNCWAKSFDLTGIAGCTVPLGGVGGGTLITKKHVLLANHVPYSTTPFMIFFINDKNVSLVYNVVKTKRVANSDILIGELDKEVDASLKVYKVLPSNFAKYFPKQAMSGEPRFPVAYSDQEKKMLMGDYLSTYDTGTEKVLVINPPTDPNALNYFEEVIGGDSGNPVCTFINNELILMGGWYQTRGPNGGWATPIHAYISEINAVISSFSAGYKLTEVDLSMFKTV